MDNNIVVSVLWASIVPLIPAFLILFVYLDAKLNWHASLVPLGRAACWQVGGTGKKVAVNSPGKYWNPISRNIEDMPDGADPYHYIYGNWLTKYLQQEWGYYWGGFFGSWKKARLKREILIGQGEMEEQDDVSKHVTTEPDIETIFIRVKFPRPVIVPSADTSENYMPALSNEGLFVLVNFFTFVFEYNASFDELVRAVRSGVNDLTRTLTYDQLRNLGKGIGSPGFSQVIVDAVNSGGMPSRFGVKLTDIYNVSFKEDKDVSEALKAKQKAEDEGKGVIAKAAAELKAAQDRADAEAALPRALAKALQEAGPNAERVTRILETRNLGQGSNLRTLLMQGNGSVNPSLALPADEGDGRSDSDKKK